MRLRSERMVEVETILVQGYIEKNEKDAPLASILSRIDTVGLKGLNVGDQFIEGIRAYLENNDLLTKKGITEKARDVIRTGRVWKGYEGRFAVKVVHDDGQYYLLDCKNFEEFKEKTILGPIDSPNLPDIYLIGDTKLKDISVNGAPCQLLKKETKKLSLIYDVSNDEITYNLEGSTFGNPGHFRLQTRREVDDIIYDLLTKYRSLTYLDGKVVCGSDLDSLTEERLNTIIKGKDGLFDIKGEGGLLLSEVMITVDDPDLAEKLYCDYIVSLSKNEYVAKNSLTDRFYDFSSLFESIIAPSTDPENLIEMSLKAAAKDARARGRLIACDDLAPSKLPQRSKYNNFTNRSVSMLDLVESIFQKDVQSVQIISKYACVNEKISANTVLFAKAVKELYGVKTHVYTSDLSRKTSEKQKAAYNSMLNSPVIEYSKVDEDIIKTIHDRYCRITTSKGIVWFGLSGELDTISFDISEPDIKTIGSVKELSVWIQDEVPKVVSDVMEAI